MLGLQTLRKRWLYLFDVTFRKWTERANGARKRTVPAERTALYILQAVLAVAGLICMINLSVARCWNPEPGAQGYMWWLNSSTPILCIGFWIFESYHPQTSDTSGAEPLGVFELVYGVFWLAGIGCSAKLFTLTKHDRNCREQTGPWPENGALVTFSVFETILFLCTAGLLLEDAPYPVPDPLSLAETANRNSKAGPGPSNIPKPHLRFGDFREYITAHVGAGESKRDFPIPKGLLCRRSKFINSALPYNWTARLGQPERAKEVYLSEDDPDTFEVYLQCVLGNTVAVKDLEDRHPTRMQSDDVFDRLIRAYVLADKLEDPESTNLLIDRIAMYSEYHRRVPKVDSIAYAYEGTVKTSLLRTLLVDLFHTGFDSDATKDENMENMPEEFRVRYTSEKPEAPKTLVVGDDKYHQRVPD